MNDHNFAARQAAALAFDMMRNRGADMRKAYEAAQRAAAHARSAGIRRAAIESVEAAGHDPRPLLPTFGDSHPVGVLVRANHFDRVEETPTPEDRFAAYVRRRASHLARQFAGMMSDGRQRATMDF
jgi:hypothetical protein